MRAVRKNFTRVEDKLILEIFNKFGKDYKAAYAALKTKHPEFSHNFRATVERYRRHLKFPEHEWTKEDDDYLLNQVSIRGKKFTSIAKDLGNRSNQQVVARYRLLIRRNKSSSTGFVLNKDTENDSKQISDPFAIFESTDEF